MDDGKVCCCAVLCAAQAVPAREVKRVERRTPRFASLEHLATQAML